MDAVATMERVKKVSFGSQGLPFVIQKGDKTHLIYYSNHDESQRALWVTTFSPFERPKTEKINGSGNSGGLKNDRWRSLHQCERYHQ